MEWVFECKPNEFDVHAEFENNCVLEWMCKNNVFIGDIVYIYVTDPEKAIRYKCRVVNVLKYHYPETYRAWYLKSDEGEVYDRSVELELIEEYPSPGITLSELREHGIKKGYSFQDKRTIPSETVEFIEKRAAELLGTYGQNIVDADDIKSLPGEERDAVVKVRVNQSKFRRDLLRKYNHCALCGVNNADLLIASHIKPWSESEKEERTDVNNGMMLCPNHDRLFDNGLISFDKNGDILISEVLSDTDKTYMNVNSNMHIEMTEKMASFMEYHAENIFKSGK